MNLKEDALKFHKDNKGKIEVKSKVAVNNKEDLTLAYSPGVAEPCLEISKDNNKVYDYTAKGNLVAVVTNGSAVLGLGDLGATSSIPVMEGKAILFKEFAGVDAFPICIESSDVDSIVETTKLISTTFGGINLEDIKAPICFEVEEKLKEIINIPVFHDDQHGTAIVTVAGFINSFKLVNKKLEDIKIILNGPGAAGIAITKLLLNMGAKNIILCDLEGAIHCECNRLDNKYKEEIVKYTNIDKIDGGLSDVIINADVFIGVSGPNCLKKEDVVKMNKNAIIFAMANPTPEIMPEIAKEAGAKIVGTGRSDYPNQVNNVLAFPGIFRGALDVRAKEINEDMKIAAAYAIANLISDDELNENNVIPSSFNNRVAPAVAMAVATAAIETNVAQNNLTPQEVYNNTLKLLNK